MNNRDRARIHAALGDERRLLIVDHLVPGDRTVAQLARVSGLEGNLLAHHLDVLTEAGLIERRVSEGDRRRRYVKLNWEVAGQGSLLRHQPLSGKVAFVCTHNSARSQFAAALWHELTGRPPVSAGTAPAAKVHPKAVRIAREFGVDLSKARPSGLDALPDDLATVVSVCDRANESEVPHADRHLHWSVPDPVPVGTMDAFRLSFTEIARRIEGADRSGDGSR